MQRVNRIVSTVFGIGYFPFAPGTLAAALAVLSWYFAFGKSENNFIQLPLIVAVSLIGVYSSGKTSKAEDKDPSFVVIDELAGMWLSLLWIPVSLTNYFAAFILFRFFDIVKPLGIRYMEKGKNGWGIMLDDLLAGIYSNIALRLFIALKLW